MTGYSEQAAIDGPRDISYRWLILAVAFIAQMLAIGSTSYAFGLFVKPVAAEYGLTRADVNLGLVLLLGGTALFSPFVGKALDRLPARRVLIIGALLYGGAALLIAKAENLALLALATFVPLALSTIALGPIMASTLIARWFDDKRGRALGIVAVSASTGGMLVVPAMAGLVETFGWRSAVAITGVCVALVVALLALLVRERRAPELAAGNAIDRGANPEIWTARHLLSTRDFWLLALAIGTMFSISQALLSSLIAYGTDRGFSAAQAAALITAVSVSSIIGKVAIGAWADVIDKRWLLAGVALLLDLFLIILILQPDWPLLMAGCLVAGAAIGGTLPLWAAIISTRFGLASFGTVMGWTAQAQLPLQLLALRFIGESYDRTGSYMTAFTTFAVIAPVAVVAALLLGRPDFKKI